MAACYCGCGRKVSGLGQRRSANRLGRRVAETLAALEAAVPGVEDKPKTREMLDERAAEGMLWEFDCRSVVHEERRFNEVAWPRMRAWLRETRGFVGFLDLSPEAKRRVMGS
jgi:hypothetical protein